MDFIKTSSLRALIELTFQRNWNGIIWMSRKGVIAKRVKTAPDGSIEKAPNRAVRLAEERMFRARPNLRPTEVSAKVQTDGRSRTRPGKHCPAVGQATTHATTTPREPGNKPRGRATLAYHGRCIRPSRERTSHVRPRTSAKSQSVDHAADRETVRPRPFRLATTDVRPIVPTTVPTPRSTRSPFEAQTYVFKPGLTLAASRKT
ncbi:unnamed protein product [Microthlaspi erraticum]|uniref:Uncharacterized protein n=1 Tax=Microthlaspi erraticum TaxID=1685480 RepID=A0A6D2KPS3_9BRAS|nr:unnamed protein product [Microthlaspi erraticum]